MIPQNSSEEVKTAFAPGNISGLFKIIHNPDPRKMHSLGWGFTVSEGVTASVSAFSGEGSVVTFNGEPIEFPTVVQALRSLSSDAFRVDLRSSLPLSSGFGLSGASTYAALIAAEQVLQSGHTRDELAMIAHIAEVKNLTGLGDVCAQHIGGCLVKTTPGDPLSAVRIEVEPQPIYWRYFSSIRTSEILVDRDRHKLINEAADMSLETLERMLQKGLILDLSQLIDIALGFATSSGLLVDSRVKESISQARALGGSASMIMLGNAVFATAPFDGSSKTTLSEVAAHAVL